MSIIGFPDLFCLPICIQRVHFYFFIFFIFLPCGQKRLNYLTRMRRGSNNRETPKGVPSSKNNRQLVTCRPFRDSCMRTKPNSYRHGSYNLGSVYRQGSKTLFHAYGPRRGSRRWPKPSKALKVLRDGSFLTECARKSQAMGLLKSLLVSVDVKIYCTVLRHWSQLVPNMSTDI